MAINSNVVSHFFHFHPDDDWSVDDVVSILHDCVSFCTQTSVDLKQYGD